MRRTLAVGAIAVLVAIVVLPTVAVGATEPTTTPTDEASGHADDPFPEWLLAAMLVGPLVGIALLAGTAVLAVQWVRRKRDE